MGSSLPVPATLLSSACPPVPPPSATCGRRARGTSVLPPGTKPPDKRMLLPGCTGEERGRSTCPKAMVIGTTTTLQIQKKGLILPALTPILSKGFPRSPGAATQSGSSPTAPSHHKQTLTRPTTLGTSVSPSPGVSLCSYLPAACPAPQAAAEPRSPGVPHGGPQPRTARQGPGPQHHPRRDAWARPGGWETCSCEGHSGARRGLIKGNRCWGPRGDASANGAAGATDVAGRGTGEG